MLCRDYVRMLFYAETMCCSQMGTNMGDIVIKLYPDECPKSVENFVTHARSGYYDGVIFHRVIKGFMVHPLLYFLC